MLAVPFVADGQPPVAGEPGRGALDLPLVPTQTLTAIDTAPGDARDDAAGPQPPAVHGIVVALRPPGPGRTCGGAAPDASALPGLR